MKRYYCDEKPNAVKIRLRIQVTFDMNNEARKSNITPFERFDRRFGLRNRSVKHTNLETQNLFTNACALLNMKCYDRAIDNFDAYLQLNPRDSQAYQYKG